MASERNKNFLIEAKQRIDVASAKNYSEVDTEHAHSRIDQLADASGSMLIVLGELLREIDILKAEKIEVAHGD